MDRMWAPWRKAYIRPSARKSKGCLFCRVGADKAHDAKNLVVARSRYNFAILNLYPYNNGHTMVVPIRHVDCVEKLSDAEKLDWLELYERVSAAIRKTMHAQGFNVGMNLGHAAGAGIPKHTHLHIVPRWIGDVNFMPTLTHAKVISESLESVYKLLSTALQTELKPRKPAKR